MFLTSFLLVSQVWASQPCKNEAGKWLKNGSFISAQAEVDEKVEVGPGTKICGKVKISKSGKIEQSNIIGPVEINNTAAIKNSTVGPRVVIKSLAGVTLNGATVIGPDSVISEDPDDRLPWIRIIAIKETVRINGKVTGSNITISPVDQFIVVEHNAKIKAQNFEFFGGSVHYSVDTQCTSFKTSGFQKSDKPECAESSVSPAQKSAQGVF